MEALFAVTGKDFVLCASDDMQARSIVVMKRKHDKSINLNKNTILISSGDNGDCVNFSEFMQKNISLLEIQYGYRLSTEEIAHYTRRNLADALRTKVKINFKILLGKYCPFEIPRWREHADCSLLS